MKKKKSKEVLFLQLEAVTNVEKISQVTAPGQADIYSTS